MSFSIISNYAVFCLFVFFFLLWIEWNESIFKMSSFLLCFFFINVFWKHLNFSWLYNNMITVFFRYLGYRIVANNEWCKAIRLIGILIIQGESEESITSWVIFFFFFLDIKFRISKEWFIGRKPAQLSSEPSFHFYSYEHPVEFFCEDYY